MRDYVNYTIEDLILDDSFVHYCLETDDSAFKEWSLWIEAHPEQVNKVISAKKLLFSLGIRLTKEEKQLELEKLKTAVSTIQQTSPVKGRIPLRLTGFGKVAVAIAACFLVFFGGYQWNKRLSSLSGPDSDLAYEIVESGIGERKKIELIDGSTVTLNSNSILKIPISFNNKKRDIKLVGEALFDVAPNSVKPFSVNADKATVMAVGTSFKVRAYSFEKEVKTTLLEGKVKVTQVNNKELSNLLSPGEQLDINKKNGLYKIEKFNPILEGNWKEGRLIFHNSSPEEIRKMLQYWYGIEVKLQGDGRKPIRFNGEFYNKELKDVLAAISYVNGLSYSVQDKQIILVTK